MWAVVRIYGSNCLMKVAALEECGAEVYCPVVKERRRIGRTRNKFVIVERSAYHGWAFMRKMPSDAEVARRPWLTYKVLSESCHLLSDDTIERIKADEMVWNMAVANQDPDKREKFLPGEKVKIEGGLLRGMIFEVEFDEGPWVHLKPLGEQSSVITKINPFLLGRVGA